jgi:hypothetical protein
MTAVGWREAPPSETPAFYLGFALQRTALIQDRQVVVGTVYLRATSSTHRDEQLATMDGSLDPNIHVLGGDAVVEIWIVDQHPANSVESFLVAHARQFSTEMWEMSQDSITGLCKWRESLGREGLAVDELRQELVKEMMAVRERARQRKELTIEVEKH